MKADTLIVNGRLYDPAANIDRTGNLAIWHRRIVSLDAKADTPAARVINAEGCLVLPGLIDLHTHISRWSTHIGMNPDIGGIANGVTAMVDCGSSGVSNFRAVLRNLEHYEVKSKLVLHVSAGGQMMSTQFAENVDPACWNLDLFERAFEEYPDRIIGIKIRPAKEVVRELGLAPFEAALRLADHLHTRLFIHATNPAADMGTICSMMRPGDVVSHIFHGEGHTLLSDGGRIDERVWQAQRRGVIMDVAQGQGNLSLDLAQQCMASGFLPDTVSTDLNNANLYHPLVFTLLMTMTKMLAAGMPLERVIRGVTAVPASVMGLSGELGTLAEGTVGDVSVLKLVDRPMRFRDRYGAYIEAEKVFMPMATVINGMVQYQSSETFVCG